MYDRKKEYANLIEKNVLQMESLQTIAEYLQFWMHKYEKKIAVEYIKDSSVVSCTYKELENAIEKCRCFMKNMGICDKRVALLGVPCYEWLVVFLSLLLEGETTILIPDDTNAIDNYVKRSEADVLFYSDQFSERVEKSSLKIGVFPYSKMDFLHNSLVSGTPTTKCCDDGKACAIIAFTSGTSAESKMVMLSQRNLLYDCLSHIQLLPFKEDERVILALPVFHMYSITAGVLIPFFWGATICIGGGAKSLMRDMLRFHPTVLILVPMILDSFVRRLQNEISKQGKEKQIKRLLLLSKLCLKLKIDIRAILFAKLRSPFGGALRYISVGGAAASTDNICFMNDIGITVYEGYGITECSPVVATNGPNQYRLGSVGMVPNQSYYQVRSIDGEICVRGNIVMMGYYHERENNIINGWFHTGDCGYFDRDGFLYITGRKNNLIVLSNGNNVYPEELETIIYRCHFVKTAMVHAQKEGNRQFLSAEIFLIPVPISIKKEIEKQVCDFISSINKGLPSYKRIGKINFLNDDLPKTQSGKVKRYLVQNCHKQ